MNPKNVRAEFARAQKSLRAAKTLQADGLYEDAVSRAYYAVMHSAKAALLVHDEVSESHAAIRRHFGSVLVRSGRIEKEWATILSREQDRRIAADYDAALSIDADASLRLVEDADRFVQRIQKYLVQKQFWTPRTRNMAKESFPRRETYQKFPTSKLNFLVSPILET